MMKEKDIPYRNSYVYVERVKEGKKILFKVTRANGNVCYTFSDKKKAITYAKHLETWRPLHSDISRNEK